MNSIELEIKINTLSMYLKQKIGTITNSTYGEKNKKKITPLRNRRFIVDL